MLKEATQHIAPNFYKNLIIRTFFFYQRMPNLHSFSPFVNLLHGYQRNTSLQNVNDLLNLQRKSIQLEQVQSYRQWRKFKDIFLEGFKPIDRHEDHKYWKRRVRFRKRCQNSRFLWERTLAGSTSLWFARCDFRNGRVAWSN